MKASMDEQIGLNLRPDDITTIMEISVEDRRTVTSVLRNLLEDIVNGVIPLNLQPEPKVKRKTTIVRVDAEFKARFKDFQESVNLSTDKIVEQALRVIRDQRAGLPPKSLDDRLNHLKHRHRHSNSPIPDELKDGNLPNVA